MSSSPREGLCGIKDLTPCEFSELVALFFHKIQTWLPLLHRPRFYAKYMDRDGTRFEDLSVEEQLMFTSMFALSARFSDSPRFEGIPPTRRGEPFAEEAKALYSLARTATDPSSLVYLQGCILLAFYHYASAPCAKGWILVGVCVRLAYDLDLNHLDDDGGLDLEPEEWVEREQLRRTWWLVWELDTFGSTVSARPYLIDKSRINVLLPVSDASWFAESPITSTMLRGNPVELLTKLQHCPNHDQRAWFLAANYLMSLASDLSQASPHASRQDIEDLEAICRCFKLSVSSRFDSEKDLSASGDPHRATRNWLICTQLMVTASLELLSRMKENLQVVIERASTSTSLPSESRYAYAARISQIVAQWSLEDISFAHPFIVCCVMPIPLLPESDSVADLSLTTESSASVRIISHYSKSWGLADSLLSLLTRIKSQSQTDQNLRKRFSIFFPRSKRKKLAARVPGQCSASTDSRCEGSQDANTESCLTTMSASTPALRSDRASRGAQEDPVDTGLEWANPMPNYWESASYDIEIDDWALSLSGFSEHHDDFMLGYGATNME